MHTPYLIQRVEVEKHPEDKAQGVDKYFGFDYMGSAEFEWGALPKAIAAMRATTSVIKQMHADKHVAWYLGPAELFDVALEFFKSQLNNPRDIHLKERTLIQEAYGLGRFEQPATIGWWDIKSTYVFFTKKSYAKKWMELL